MEDQPWKRFHRICVRGGDMDGEQDYIDLAHQKGFEGIGFIPYVEIDGTKWFALRLNENQQADFILDICKETDKDEREGGLSYNSAAHRVVKERTNLDFPIERICRYRSYRVHVGITGRPFHIFVVEITIDEFNQMIHGSSKFVLCKNPLDPDRVETMDGETFKFCAFSAKIRHCMHEALVEGDFKW